MQLDSPTVLDALILLWLIGTWFYEGHHRKCKVTVTCPHCGEESDQTCTAGQHDHDDEEEH